ncbi:reverse transcriptase [Senna tora]|uniref:Reverse transcriptase n=1 Tax=Senna tora TaxID=362788 RepID=A0A834SW20_9FABA|nr:reverse transcriptase [Senna tora]
MENPDDCVVQGEILWLLLPDASFGESPLGDVSNSLPSPQHSLCKGFLPDEGLREPGRRHWNPAGVDAGVGVENVGNPVVLHQEPGGPCSNDSSEAQWNASCTSPSINPVNAFKKPCDRTPLSIGSTYEPCGDRTNPGRPYSNRKSDHGSAICREPESPSGRYVHHYLSAARNSSVGLCGQLQTDEIVRAWNARGATSTSFKRLFMDLKNQYKPNLVLISDTKIGGNRAEEILSTLGFSNHFKVDPMGYAGGLWLLWDNKQIDVTVHEHTFQEIHTTVEVTGYPPFFASFIYASPNRERRKIFWDNLVGLTEFVNLPWLMGGDFNDILHADEKWGSKFTRWNKRPNGTIVFERLDRFFASVDWINIFPQATNYHLPRIKSDHNPMFLTSRPMSYLCAQRPFRCERIWLNQPGFANLTKESWHNNPSLFQNLPDFTTKIKDWNKKEFGDIFTKKRKILSRLQGIQRINNLIPFLTSLENQLSLEYQEILVLEEELWASKARIDCDRLKNDTPPILISSSVPSELEIFYTLSQLKPFKAPGPDGFQPGFFQKYWLEVKESLCTEIRALFGNPQLLENWNDTFISLIPKINNPTEINSFRPISLCNTVYKLVAKILVNRLKPIIPSLISFNQGAFVPGRKAIDNVAWLASGRIITLFLKRFLLSLKPGSPNIFPLRSMSKGKIHLVGWNKFCINKMCGGLSIMKSRERNLAFLGKLAWRVYQESNSTWAKICSYRMNLTSPRASLMGKSISIGLSVLSKGVCKVPMSGSQSNFWCDNWSRFGVIRNLIEGPLALHEDGLCVSDLSSFPGIWDWVKISFDLPSEIKHKFKSAYDLLVDNLDTHVSANISWHSPNFSWIWSLNSLLQWLKVNSTCKEASFRGIPHGVLFIHVLWFVWIGRNGKIFNNEAFSPSVIWRKACGRAAEFYCLAGNGNGQSLSKSIEVKWKPPPDGGFKLNTDSSRLSDTGFIAAGGVIRDSLGNWMKGFNFFLGIGDIITAELWAIFRGLKLTEDFGYSPFLIDSDSLTAVTLIKNLNISTSHSYFPLIHACRSLLERQPHTSLNHTFCEANSCADGLAKRAVLLKFDLCIFNDVPPFISLAFEALLGVPTTCRIGVG